ncbi:MAG: murein L,D-transpeptidase catalytic domain family protein [Candidatus Pseudobacter hemicellulosilyticus]|uniref:Murein L,D-transpeptidase catalytic domain family protein n=1 Tax=Candidatus Pseudobacter hemicellulosilyticus TaxID=3121375 RepID=A0AAJ5WQ28_9BACT|nr:MAG: murein L,D-transpeptidase catalytic domain family protein [Pseudobacter sp.]
MRALFILLFACACAGFAWYFVRGNYFSSVTHPSRSTPNNAADRTIQARATQKAASIKSWLKQHRYNQQFCLMADLSAPSGKDRFFMYDLQKDSIVQSGLVTHGRCNETWLNGRKYSNVVGSGCSSPGKYKIGQRYHGRFGLAYKLHGLDSSNSNAYKRAVVLHAHDCVPSRPIHPMPICQSDGCPTLSRAFLKLVAEKIDAADKPVLLWIYD